MRSNRSSAASARSPSSLPNRPSAPSSWICTQIVEERIAFLKSAHPEVRYAVEVAANTPSALADQDLVKGILVNLLENAAEAAGDGGQILARVRPIEDRVAIEVHDSGPGLSDLARNVAFPAHHLIQEARHGARALHRAQERPAFGRRHPADRRRTRRRRVSACLLPAGAARSKQCHPGAFWSLTTKRISAARSA